ncbi:transposase [Pseudomonas sp. RIT-PI-AD]|uniref:transposase n=1 Tax=Pseudomonas sp. RIT-PI-AD TaxID=3035294 RepID=UPI00320AEFD3
MRQRLRWRTIRRRRARGLGRAGHGTDRKRSELHTFKVMPKRWVVERSFAWLEKSRRLWKNCERKLNTSLQPIHLAFLALLLRRSWTGS